MLFVDQTELIILLVVCAIAAGCFIATVALTVWVMINRQRGQKAKRELTGITVDATAAKQTFAAGEEFTCEGLIVNAAYNMEPTEEVLTQFDVLTEVEFAHLAAAGAANGLYVIKPDMAEEGKALVIIRYRDRAAYYPITVSAPIREAQTPAEEVQAEQTEPEAIEEAPAEAEEAVVVEEPAEVPAEVEKTPAEISEPVAEIPVEIPTVLFEGSGVRYNRSFTAKLIQSDDEVKGWYTALKNELLSYKKVKSRMSWKRESFRLGRNITARFAFRGNTLCIYLPLDPAAYEGTKYKVEDASGYAYYADTPCMYRVKGARRARYAAELIAASMDALGIGRIEREAEEYYLPYEETEALIGRGLIKYENAGNAGGAFLPQSAAAEVAITAEVPEEAKEAVVVEELAEVSVEVEEAPAESPEPVAEIPVEIPTVLFEGNGVRCDRSFTAKLIQSDDEVKGWYTALKNELLSYKKVKARMSWKRESYRYAKKNVVRFSFRGKTLCAYFALDPNEFEGTKYKVEAAEGSTSYTDTPCMYRIKNDKRVRYAKELIAMIMEGEGAVKDEDYAPEDADIPFEETEVLIGRGLIKYENTGNAGGAFLPQSAAAEVAITAEVPAEVPAEEAAEEETTEEPVEEQPAEEEAPVEESVPEEEPEEEPTGEPTVEETAEEEPVEEAEVPAEETIEEPVEEVPETTAEIAEETVLDEVKEEQIEEAAEEEAEVEELSKREIADVQAYEEEAKDEDGIEVVGVMFRRRGRKVYWFDPDGKTWVKGEIALYKSPDDPPQEVIVVDNAKISPSKLHLPLKPLHKASHRLQVDKK